MGREIKRVALDFIWPLEKIWPGFVNPYANFLTPCSACESSGNSPEAAALIDLWYGKVPFAPKDRGSTPHLATDEGVLSMAQRNLTHAPGFYGRGQAALEREAHRLVEHFNSGWSHHLNQANVDALIEAGRLMEFTHDWIAQPQESRGWVPKNPPVRPTVLEINRWSLGMGHDTINCMAVVRDECQRGGIPTVCPECHGEGARWWSDEVRLQSQAWQRTEPPSGEGWQLWETVTDGSPISNIFGSAEAFKNYLVSSLRWSDERAREFVEDGSEFTLSINHDTGELRA